MRLSSIRVVVLAGERAARRFPLVLAAGFLAAAAAIALVDRTGNKAGYARLLAAATLGLPLLFALTMLAERRARGPAQRWSMLGVGVIVLAGVWAAWPGWSPAVQFLRYAQLSAAFHLAVAVVPYAGYHEPNGFWQYNRALFLRFLTASLYSAVLFGGLAIALLALDRLLGVHVSSAEYARLWIVIAFIFNTWFFVGGVPDDVAALEAQADYPGGLRIFAQYVLVPIVAIYLVILTIYLGKVLVTRQWPSGWIGYLVSSVACVGILAWLLVYPLEQRAEYGWVRPFTKGFYIVLMPAIVMLWLAIGKRIAQYGITEPRYFLAVLSVWLAGIALYYTVGRSRAIIVIPATLGLVALITFAGPWSAYAVSRASQVSRLQAALTRNGLLVNGMLQRPAGVVPLADRQAISSGIRYLVTTHGAGTIARWLPDSLQRALASGAPGPRRWNAGSQARAILASVGLEYNPTVEAGAGPYFSYYADTLPNPLAIGGYDYAIHVTNWTVRDSLPLAPGTVLKLASDSLGFLVWRRGAPVFAISLRPVLDSAVAYRRSNPNRPVPATVLRLETRSGRAAALAYFRRLDGVERAVGPRLRSFDGELYLRLP